MKTKDPDKNCRKGLVSDETFRTSQAIDELAERCPCGTDTLLRYDDDGVPYAECPECLYRWGEGKVVSRFRAFQAKEVGQVTACGGTPSHPESWHWEPVGYEGDILWSEPFKTQEEATRDAVLHGLGCVQRSA